MTINLDTLRKTAEAATQADWYALRVGIRDEKEWVIDSHPTFICSMQIDGERAKFDAEFIATFDPPTVLALLSRLEQAEANFDEADSAKIAAEGREGQALERLEQAEQAVQRVREVIRQYDPDCLTCMCNSDGDCCKCTVFDFQEALDGDGRG